MEAVEKVKKFVGDQKPYAVSYVNQFDMLYWYKLTGGGSEPFFWLPIDFSSMLFGWGIDPEAYNWQDRSNFYKQLGIDHTKYHEHNALDDAKLLREVYLKFLELDDISLIKQKTP